MKGGAPPDTNFMYFGQRYCELKWVRKRKWAFSAGRRGAQVSAHGHLM